MDPRAIQQLEDKCVQNQAPFCTASCPAHVDVRGVNAAIAQGDFTEALALYQKKVLFPGIVARICAHPCQSVCRRQEKGGDIKINLLERACVIYGEKNTKAKSSLLEKKQVIAIVGGGLSGLAAAQELGMSGYQVELFEQKNKLGGQVWDIARDILPETVIFNDFSGIEDLQKSSILKVYYGWRITDYELLKEKYAAVYVAVGDAPTFLEVDPVSLQTQFAGVFVADRVFSGRHSAIHAIADGQRAVVSIIRYMKNVSLTAGREKEGVYESTLYTNLDEYFFQQAVASENPDGSYSVEQAIAEAQRCFHCECLECVKVCPYLQHFDQYPGNCLRSISKNLIIMPGFGMRLANDLINSCSLCGLCKEVCPTDIDMARVNQDARNIMVEKNYMPEMVFDFPVREMTFSNSPRCSLSRHQLGTRASKYVFFPGCQLGASKPDKVFRTYKYLTEQLEGGVGIMLWCCGAPASWAGRQLIFKQEMEEMLNQWEALGRPEMIVACPTCYQMIRMNAPQITIKSLWELFMEIGLPWTCQNGAGKVVAVHDSCTARYEPQQQDAVRMLLVQAGFTVHELPLCREKTECCGYGGLMYHINPLLVDKVIRSRIELSEYDYVTYCVNCRDFYASGGKQSWHMLDIIFPDEGYVPEVPSYSQKHRNKLALKKRFLAEIWQEAVDIDLEYEKMALVISPKIEETMERQFILKDDIQQVIYEAERSGNKLYHPRGDYFSAYLRPEIRTYWVEYAICEARYVIRKVYSHRLQLL